MNNKLDSVISLLLAFNIYFTLSPFVFSTGYAGPISTLTSIILILALIFKCKLRIKNNTIYLIIPIGLSFCVAALYWQEIMLVNYPKFLLFAIVIVSMIDLDVLRKFTSLSTIIITIAVIFSVIGFVYAALGGVSNFTIVNPTGREFYFYLTTFTVTNYSGFIRPSAFFDEPGALSFYICFVVMLREIVHPYKRTFNYFLLIMGGITLSLAHIVFACLYIVYCLITRFSTKLLLLLLGAIFFALILFFFLPNKDIVIEYLMSRSTSDVDGQGRSGLLQAAINVLSDSDGYVYLFGIDSNCLVNYDEACRYVYPRMGETPLSPLVFGGLMTSWLYYIIYVYFGCKTVVKISQNLLILSFLLLFLQRPYIYLISYSMMFALAIVIPVIMKNAENGFKDE